MILVNPFSGSNTDIPNISLAYCATIFKASVIDLNTRPRPRRRYLDKYEDVLGISVQSRTYSEADRIRRDYLRKYPSAKVKSVTSSVDVQCCYPYLKFTENLEIEEPFSDKYPFPEYGLFDSFGIFLRNWQKGYWAYSIMTSIGCPFKCKYCMSANRKWLSRSAENCYQEIEEAKEKLDIKKFHIIDDCFNIDRSRVLRFCSLAKDLKLVWSCANGLRADLFDEEQARAMFESGCEQISLGIESIDDGVLAQIQKGETASQIEQAVDIAKRVFKKVNGFFIIGLPGSSYEKDLKSLEWARAKGINAHFSYYVPFEHMSFDALFYGRPARPLSNAYPKELQKKIYRMTQNMRPAQGTFLRRIFAR